MRTTPILVTIAGMMLATAMAPDPAAADVTLRYAATDDPDRTLVIEADDAGRIRAEDSNGQSILISERATLMLFPGKDRAFTRLEDFRIVGGEIRAELVADGRLVAGGDQPYRLADEGAATIGTWRGKRYSIDPEGPGITQEIVIATDPSLAEARRAAVKIFETLNIIGGAVLIEPPQFTRLVKEVLAKGMPIAVDGLVLKSIATGKVPEARFAAPASVLTLDQLRARKPN